MTIYQCKKCCVEFTENSYLRRHLRKNSCIKKNLNNTKSNLQFIINSKNEKSKIMNFYSKFINVLKEIEEINIKKMDFDFSPMFLSFKTIKSKSKIIIVNK
jgi:hypothetical protein